MPYFSSNIICFLVVMKLSDYSLQFVLNNLMVSLFLNAVNYTCKNTIHIQF